MSGRDFESAKRIARELAPILGPGWRAGFPPGPDFCDWVDLTRADGAGIRVTVGGYRLDGRVVFRGLWPKFRDGHGYIGGKSLSITCDAGRPARALAGELARRLLPAYEREFAKARAFVTDHDTNSDEAEQVAHRLATVIDGEVGPNHSRRGDGVAIHREPEPVRRLVVQPAYSGVTHSRTVSVDFEVRGLDPETAAEVLRVIKDADDRLNEGADAHAFRVADSLVVHRAATVELVEGDSEYEHLNGAEPKRASVR